MVAGGKPLGSLCRLLKDSVDLPICLLNIGICALTPQSLRALKKLRNATLGELQQHSSDNDSHHGKSFLGLKDPLN
jgi:hypothetical protein